MQLNVVRLTAHELHFDRALGIQSKTDLGCALARRRDGERSESDVRETASPQQLDCAGCSEKS